ncbi:hypothetical protein [Brevundimonas sp. Root1279]|uniref:hypothetical protein n=1 Tax=Brevundimonas sp. Root1279 TaxID=1736443 RepID=UPI0012E33C20|nr:hypothetical protein [Brevundimonas sp. Root1279]
MLQPLLAFIAAMGASQEQSTLRPSGANDNRVMVAYADAQVASAVGWSTRLPDGSLGVSTYTVFRRGTRETNWTTPAYNIDRIDFRCDERTFRVGGTRLFRANADPLVSPVNNDGPFKPIEGDVLRERQFEAVCGTASLITYPTYFYFMEAYGLGDGRSARVEPGPMVH